MGSSRLSESQACWCSCNPEQPYVGTGVCPLVFLTSYTGPVLTLCRPAKKANMLPRKFQSWRIRVTTNPNFGFGRVHSYRLAECSAPRLISERQSTGFEWITRDIAAALYAQLNAWVRRHPNCRNGGSSCGPHVLDGLLA